MSSKKKGYRDLMSDLGLECPPDFDPRFFCICCEFCSDGEKDLEKHLEECHPDYLDHWKMILLDWNKKC